jgi:hypothetical protein
VLNEALWQYFSWREWHLNRQFTFIWTGTDLLLKWLSTSWTTGFRFPLWAGCVYFCATSSRPAVSSTKISWPMSALNCFFVDNTATDTVMQYRGLEYVEPPGAPVRLVLRHCDSFSFTLYLWYINLP